MLFYLVMVPSTLQTSNNSQLLTQVRKARPGSVEFREQVEVALEKCLIYISMSMSMPNVNVSNEGLAVIKLATSSVRKAQPVFVLHFLHNFFL